MLDPISFLRYKSSHTTYLSKLLVNPSHGFTKSSSIKTTPATKTSTANRCYIDFPQTLLHQKRKTQSKVILK